MKNERIITHFQSYTTAQGCVKALTAHFAGRISVAAVKSPDQPDFDADTSATAGQTATDRDDWLNDLGALGGIALGTVADMIPGLGPVLSGGPVVGAVVGEVFGDYMVARGHLGRVEDDANDDPPVVGTVYVAVDVQDEEETALAEHLIREHGGDPYRVLVGDVADKITGVAAPESPAAVHYTMTEPQDRYADGMPQPTGQAQRRIPHDDGYTLDPLPPFSPQRWIDPNIGVGDLELVDPTIFAHDDEHPHE